MGIEITHHEMPKDEFDFLEAKYPNGRYSSGEHVNWFCVYIAEMDLELTWFMKRERVIE